MFSVVLTNVTLSTSVFLARASHCAPRCGYAVYLARSGTDGGSFTLGNVGTGVCMSQLDYDHWWSLFRSCTGCGSPSSPSSRRGTRCTLTPIGPSRFLARPQLARSCPHSRNPWPVMSHTSVGEWLRATSPTVCTPCPSVVFFSFRKLVVFRIVSLSSFHHCTAARRMLNGFCSLCQTPSTSYYGCA